jgi:hypothetical protein
MVVVLGACHGDDHIPPPMPDAGTQRVAVGTQVVDHAAYVGGITVDGDVIFYDTNADGHTVAKAVPLAGGDVVTIATSAGTGKADVRFEIDGHVVFAWTDRGNRVANLTIWSRATGTIAIGPNVRPGRAAATSDGAYVLYERDVTANTVSVVGGPIAGTHALLATANSLDSSCWQNTDLAASGDRLVARYCPDPATAFTLATFAANGQVATLASDVPGAFYGANQIVWRDATGVLTAAAADGTAPQVLGSDVAEFAISADESTAAYRTNAGAIATAPLAGGSATTLVASGAMALGALSPDRQTVLYASAIDDRGTGFVQPYTDVQLVAPSAAHALVPTPTSCAGCMASPFTPDGQYVLELDPIDNSSAADAAGPLHVFRAATGESIGSFGSVVYNALAIGDQLFAFDAARDATLDSGWSYGLTLVSPDLSTQAIVARVADGFALDPAHMHVAVSFTDTGDRLAGIWVAPVP